jgi:bifunctional UDP-N-acetylglucosamine pyrophosphorylase/glucosamine-1-phosphate N-acetyltransferase/UDP-N-acetylglucosamine pyrophosphorylase
MDGPVAVVLAAGKGTRMKSDLPKVLCPALGRPMIQWVVEALLEVAIQRVLVVVGYRSDLVRSELADRPRLRFVEQTEQLGTGHAVMVCREQLQSHRGPVLILAGDSPLVQPRTLRRLLDEYDEHRPACILGTLNVDDPTGLGRIVRDDQGAFVGIVEQKDATPQQSLIREVNMSTYVFDADSLLSALSQLQNNNRQREYYLTDCPGILRASGHDVRALPVLQPCEGLSVNNLEELGAVEAEMRRMGYLHA